MSTKTKSEHEVILADEHEPQLPSTIQSNTIAVVKILDRAVSDPTMDLDRVERLMSMWKDAVNADKEMAFNAALSACQAEMEPVVKNRRNSHTNSNYADLAAVHSAIVPVYTRHGFGTSFSPVRSEIQGFAGLQLTVSHRDGFSKSITDYFPLDVAGAQGKMNKTGLQGQGSTYSYGRRYMECLFFNVATTDDNDGNPASANYKQAAQGRQRTAAANNAAAPLNKKQREALNVEINKAGVTEQYVCDKAGISRLDDLAQSRLQGCISHLQNISKNKLNQG